MTDRAADLPHAPFRLTPKAVVALLVATVCVGAGGGALIRLARHQPARPPALPAFNGQAVWAGGTRRAPGFALRDQSGTAVSLASLRGRPVLLTFLDSQCRSSCPVEGRQLASILRRLPSAQRPVVVVVSVDQAGDTPASVGRALAKWQLRGPWTVHWLNAPTRAGLAAVWRSYGVRVVPATNDVVHSLALYLIDRRGFERTAYLFPFLPEFVQRDLSRLALGAA